MAEAPKCPTCGHPSLATRTRWGVRYDHCGLWAWGNYPLVDEATHDARRAAHKAFDRTWMFNQMDRREAYRQLALLMGLEPRDCHMKVMTKEQAEKVLTLVGEIKP